MELLIQSCIALCMHTEEPSNTWNKLDYLLLRQIVTCKVPATDKATTTVACYGASALIKQPPQSCLLPLPNHSLVFTW